MPTVRTSYDDVPYPSYPMPQTHPDYLAILATLLNLKPTPPDRCRVLELGCASGGNLIPMAVARPDSRFVGIDMSSEQIADGQRTITSLNLPNIELRALSILEVDESFGQFDYIICHGVYSWVPTEVQTKILEICRQLLVPNGVGYISYNTHPGWHLRGLIRHMMSYHVGRYPDDTPEMSIARARRLLDFLASAAPERDRAYSSLLREQAELLAGHSDAYLFHEHLEEHNEPVWFLDFCERLGTHRLRYLAEAEFGSMIAGLAFPPEVQVALNELAPNMYEKEQYMDFVRNRSFRQTLVCHDRLRPNYDLSPRRLAGCWVASPVRPEVTPASWATDEPVKFVATEELHLECSVPLVKAALSVLGNAWPGAVPFEQLVREARELLVGGESLTQDESEDAAALAQSLLSTFARAHGMLLQLSLAPPRVATAVEEYPEASPLARLQAQQQRPIANLRHEVVRVSPFDRHLLPLIDGTRNEEQLLAGLLDRFRHGELNISQDDQPLVDESRAEVILREILHQQLPALLRASLLLPGSPT